MQRAEYGVTGQRSLHRNFGRFDVSNFADQNLIRILPQDRSQRQRERHSDSMINRNLNNAIDVVLDRIFGRDQFVFDLIELAER